MGWRVAPCANPRPRPRGDSSRCGAGRGGPAHRARGGTPSPQGRFMQVCTARCAAGMRSEGGGGRRGVPGGRDKKKRKEKAQSIRELTPPFDFHQLAPLSGPLRPPGRAAVMGMPLAGLALLARRRLPGCASRGQRRGSERDWSLAVHGWPAVEEFMDFGSLGNQPKSAREVLTTHQLLNYFRESYGAKNFVPLHFNNGEPAPACNHRAPSPSYHACQAGRVPPPLARGGTRPVARCRRPGLRVQWLGVCNHRVA